MKYLITKKAYTIFYKIKQLKFSMSKQTINKKVLKPKCRQQIKSLNYTTVHPLLQIPPPVPTDNSCQGADGRVVPRGAPQK